MTERQRNWTIKEGEGPIIAVAIHDGSFIRDELRNLIDISDSLLRHEEDHYTGQWTDIVDTSIVVHSSRFECDMNRPRDRAVYLTPEEAWGLKVWKQMPKPDVLERSLKLHDEFYADLGRILKKKEEIHGRFVVLDIHSYNHRRGGPEAMEDSPFENPDINLGTGSMDRVLWAPVVESFIDSLRGFDYPGGKLDVRENVKFKGGYLSSWVNETFPGHGCALAIEIKKFYMGEWSGKPYPKHIEAVRNALSSTVPGITKILAEWN